MNKTGWFIILVATGIVIVIWVVVDIVLAKPSVTVDSSTQALIEPLDPTFDQTLLTRIANIYKPTVTVRTPAPSIIAVSPPPFISTASADLTATPSASSVPLVAPDISPVISTGSGTGRTEL